LSRWNNCAGTFRYGNGNVYVGEYKDGQRSGRGFIDIVNKSCGTNLNCIGSLDHAQYVGQWERDAINGYGVWVTESGEKYEGYFQTNVRDGRGRLSTPSATFEGYFRNGQYVGNATR
jgi:hypothetical protein